MARVLSVTLLVLGLAGAAYWMGLKSRDVAQARSQLAIDSPAQSVPAPLPPEDLGSVTVEPAGQGQPVLAPQVSSPQTRQIAPGPAAHPVTRTSLAQMNARAMQQMNEIDGGNLQRFVDRVRTGDGEAAFALFHKAMACAHAPETEAALMGRIEDIYQGSQDNPDAEKMMDQVSEHFVKKYEDCENFPRGLTGMLDALEWLQAAVDLRFPPAHGAYVTYGKSIVQQAALRRPDLVMRYRDQALAEMRMMLSAGNPDAFMVHAREYSTGDLLEQDWLLSYAYAHAVGLANPGDNSGEYLLKEAERHLTPDQLRDAREHGRELCEAHCN